MGHLYLLQILLKNLAHDTYFSVSYFPTFQNNYPATACWILIIAIHPLLASLGVARAPHRVLAGQITRFSKLPVIHPPLGLPAGRGGDARSGELSFLSQTSPRGSLRFSGRQRLFFEVSDSGNCQ